MNVALEFGKPKICCIIIVYKVEAWARRWLIDNGHGIAPKNYVEYSKDYGF
jgi:hypothetical protein